MIARYLFAQVSRRSRQNKHPPAAVLLYTRSDDRRHTFVTWAAERGVSLVTLAALLGHSKINMVLRYAHPPFTAFVLARG